MGSDVLLGVDVSSYQGKPSWAAVAASGRSFAWTKATEGTRYVNPTFAYNWPAIRDAGMVRGAYHYARPDLNSPEAEADYFLNAVADSGDFQPTDLLALDLEAGPGNLLDWALRFQRLVLAGAGWPPMVYSGTWFLGPHGCIGSPELSQYPLWLSGYVKNMPAVPDDWPCIAMWQYTDRASVPGIDGPVDQSYFLGDLPTLHAYGRPDPTMADTAPTLPSKASQHVTIYSVIGENTYPDGSNIDEQAEGQPEGVTHRIFIRELCQHGKALEGA